MLEKVPDNQHCKWGEGESLLGVPTILSGIVGGERLVAFGVRVKCLTEE